MSLPSLRLTASLAALGAATVVLSAPATSARADEGMWTFDNFPVARANQTLGTDIDQAFLDRVRLSSVKFGGCSAGVVSGQGLVMTNNHCVATCVANLSTPQVNYAETGFLPKSREEELKCPGATAEILTDISDVTERMHKAGAGLEGQAFTQARDAEAGAGGQSVFELVRVHPPLHPGGRRLALGEGPDQEYPSPIQVQREPGVDIQEREGRECADVEGILRTCPEKMGTINELRIAARHPAAFRRRRTVQWIGDFEGLRKIAAEGIGRASHRESEKYRKQFRKHQGSLPHRPPPPR